VRQGADTRAELRARLAAWPAVDDATAQWLRSLPWRVRQAVILVYGERFTACDAAARLGISERTVFYDLGAADARFQESRAEGQKLLLC